MPTLSPCLVESDFSADAPPASELCFLAEASSVSRDVSHYILVSCLLIIYTFYVLMYQISLIFLSFFPLLCFLFSCI
uniref:Uncharacterized protein n=1 Tax=Rhizophora mucronata TaxID=61149 RepID=A0A2P2QGU7_RHIMU